MKRVLIKMENDGIINMASDVTKFCVCMVAIHTTTVGLERLVSSWNHHFISGMPSQYN